MGLFIIRCIQFIAILVVGQFWFFVWMPLACPVALVLRLFGRDRQWVEDRVTFLPFTMMTWLWPQVT